MFSTSSNTPNCSNSDVAFSYRHLTISRKNEKKNLDFSFGEDNISGCQTSASGTFSEAKSKNRHEDGEESFNSQQNSSNTKIVEKITVNGI